MSNQKPSSNAQACGAQVASEVSTASTPQYQQIKLAPDVHAASIVVVRMVEGAKPQPPQSFKPAERGRLMRLSYGSIAAIAESVNLASRSLLDTCRRWYDRKKAKTSTVLAIKALAFKLAKVVWHLMTHQSDYEASRMFPELAQGEKMNS